MKTKNTLFSLLFLSALSLNAADYVVTSNADAGVGTLRQALADASANAASPHSITFSGVSSITLASALTTFDKTMTIDGGTGVTIIGSSATANMLNLYNPSTTQTFKNITFSGAVLSISSTGIFDNCTFTGGGLGAIKVQAKVTCNNCLFYGNTNTGAGGTAINGLNIKNDVTLNNCVIRNNGNATSDGNGGAAVFVKGPGAASKLTMSNCQVYNNVNKSTGYIYGGGISSAGVTTITNCAIYNNEANRGGGIALQIGDVTYPSKLTMTGCTVSGNSLGMYIEKAYGGGIFIQGGAGLYTDNCEITNCTISGNSTPVLGYPTNISAGGGIFVGGGSTPDWTTTVTINNCTIYGNNAQGNTIDVKGGGIDRVNGTVLVNYSIVIGNNSNGDPLGKNILNTPGWLTSEAGRNIYEGIVLWMNGSEETGNILTDAPSTVLNTTLADNGGTTSLPDGSYVKTHALVIGSLAINPTAAFSNLQTVDQRGTLRDATPDMGAYEFVDKNSALIRTLDVNDILLIKSNGIEMRTSAKVEVYTVRGELLKSLHANEGEFVGAPKGISVIRVTTLKGSSAIKFIN